MNKIAKIMAVGSFAAMFSSNPVIADEKPLEKRVVQKELPKRVFAPYFLSNNSSADPRFGFEANSRDWHSFNQLVGKGSDVLGEKFLDEYWFSRVGLVLLHSYLGEFSNYFSHELAHGFYSAKYSDNDYYDWMNFEFGVPKDGKYSGIFFRNTSNMDVNFLVQRFDLDGFLASITSGINQQEENMRLLHEECIREDRIFFDEGLLFVLNKIHPLKYIISESDYKKQDVIGWFSGDEMIPDPVGYVYGLRLKGINLEKKDLLVQNSIAVFGSLQFYYNWYAVMNYIGSGKRSVGQAWIETPVFDIGLPNINYYWTKNGGFYNINAFFKGKNGLIVSAEVGTDVDGIGDGRVDHLRFGGKVYDIAFVEHDYFPIISPFAYINLKKKEFLYDGFLAGAEVAIPVFVGDELNAGITAKIEYSENDILENNIKIEPEGWNVSAGLRFRF
ncbi:hypothetical protein HY484_00020 [Candidatus Woesearchaeota archaeon]|nr:hypothetical protein [Candidatus Woesearchaeota archaeon]